MDSTAIPSTPKNLAAKRQKGHIYYTFLYTICQVFYNLLNNCIFALLNLLLICRVDISKSSAIFSRDILSRNFRFNIMRSFSSNIQRSIRFSHSYRSRLLSSIMFKIFYLHPNKMGKLNFHLYAFTFAKFTRNNKHIAYAQ